MKIYRPTMNLRFVDTSDCPHAFTTKTLQQQWLCDDGSREWRNVDFAGHVSELALERIEE